MMMSIYLVKEPRRQVGEAAEAAAADRDVDAAVCSGFRGRRRGPRPVQPALPEVAPLAAGGLEVVIIRSVCRLLSQ